MIIITPTTLNMSNTSNASVHDLNFAPTFDFIPYINAV